MLLFLVDIIIISVLILSFAAFVFLYINPDYTINILKKDIIKQTCSVKKRGKSVDSEDNDDTYEVYNISPNIYTYQQAENVCKGLKGELATKKQLDKAFKKGASWCNYGWTKGQSAYYPTQAAFYSELQKDPNLKDACGNIGVNGGYFKDTTLKFGVNCYGKKPNKVISDIEYANVLDMVIPPTEKSKGNSTKTRTITREPILNFNMNNWSELEIDPKDFDEDTETDADTNS